MIKKTDTPLPVPPGETLKEYLFNWDMTQKELSERLGISPKHINEIIKGKVPITTETALKLESVLGLPASFWIGLESTYQEARARTEEAKSMEKEIEIVKSINFPQLVKLNWVKATKIIEEKVKYLRSFFQVANLTLIPTTMPVAFRVSTTFEPTSYALATWLRRGEILASEIETKSFSKRKFNQLLKEIRTLTVKPQEEYIPLLEKKLADCGIALVLVPHINKTHAQGAINRKDSNKIILQLSNRGSYADIFWFSLFHELGHIYYGHNKNEILIDDLDSNSEFEQEANTFASERLIPFEKYNNLIKQPTITRELILSFAKEEKIHPGVVVGRLCHDNVIHFSNFNDLRQKILPLN
ncbi:HigA family addiction module antidote protein [bacterium]|nr:HigA family addiction module antidote protein [bacterium]